MSVSSAAAASTQTRLRALVVESDAAVRLKVSGLLQRQGCEVHACEGFADAAEIYDLQDIVITPFRGADPELNGFVERIRASSGEAQPYILGLTAGSNAGSTARPADFGMNDVLPWPVDAGRLATRLTSIIRERRERPLPGIATAPHDGWTSQASQILLEQLPAAVAVLDRNLVYLAANQRWRSEFQLTGIQLIGQSHFAVFPDLHPAWRELYGRCLGGHRERSDDDLLVRPDGSQDWVRWDIQPWQQADREIGGLVLTCTLVSGTRRDRAAGFEQNLAHSLLNAPTTPVAVVDLSGRIVRISEAARKLAGATVITEGQTFFWNGLIPPARREAARTQILELLALAGSGRIEGGPLAAGSALVSPSVSGLSAGTAWSVFPHRRADGTLEGLILLGFEPVVATALPAMTQSATPAGIEAATIAPPAECRGDDFRLIAEAAPFGMIVLNEEAEVLYANPQHRAVLGFSVSECGGMTQWLERACAADDEFRRKALDEWWERVWRRHSAWTCSLRTDDGMLKEVEFRPSQLPGHRLLLTIFDVTDARMEEQAIRASEARYRGLFQNCAAGVAIVNASGNITEVNPVFEQITGCSRLELRKAGLGALLPEHDAARLREAIGDGEPPASELVTVIRAKDGTEKPVGISLSIVKNDEGVPVYTACYVHPLSPPEEKPVDVPAAWRGSDWSRTVPDIVLLVDGRGAILDHSDARDFAGVLPRADALTGRTLDEALPGIAELLPLDVMIERLKENPGAETRCEFQAALAAAARPRFIEARMVCLTTEEDAERYGLVLRDVSAIAGRPQPVSGGALAWFRSLSQPVILSNERGRITGMNPAAEALLGWNSSDLEGSGLFRIFRPDNPKSFSEEISGELSRHRCWKTRTVWHHHDGSTGEADVELVPAHDEATGSRGFLTILRPVTAEEKPAAETAPAPAAAAASGRPVVTLHRARNDIQILSSLLTLQADKAGEASVRAALLAAKDRLSAVALTYRLIGGEEDTIDFARYAGDLGRMLLDSHGVTGGRVKIETAFDAVRLPQKAAITLGIILEELITASLTESFPDETSGTIRVSLTIGGGEGVLIVRDNGALLTDSVRSDRMTSFTWQVVQMLAEQVGGVLTLLGDLENQVRLRFRLNPA